MHLVTGKAARHCRGQFIDRALIETMMAVVPGRKAVIGCSVEEYNGLNAGDSTEAAPAQRGL